MILRRYVSFFTSSLPINRPKRSQILNPLTHGWLSDPYFKVLWEGCKAKFCDFFFIGASATKRFARSRIFRYGCLKIILSKTQKAREGGAKGLNLQRTYGFDVTPFELFLNKILTFSIFFIYLNPISFKILIESGFKSKWY